MIQIDYIIFFKGVEITNQISFRLWRFLVFMLVFWEGVSMKQEHQRFLREKHDFMAPQINQLTQTPIETIRLVYPGEGLIFDKIISIWYAMVL